MTTKYMPIRTQAEDKVLRCARKLARMKAHGSYVENDLVHYVCGERARYIEAFTHELIDAASDLLNAMAIDEVDGRIHE